jgi:hypothetical protein
MTMLIALAALAAAAQTDTLTLGEARALPPAALAARVLGPLGRLYPEARPLADARGTRLFDVELGGAPRSEGVDGVCVSDRLMVHFTPALENDPVADPESRIEAVAFIPAYRLVGEAERFATGEPARNHALIALCGRAGTVLDHGGPHYFYLDQNSGDVSMIARAFTLIRRQARQGPMANLTCTENPNAPRERFCADPRGILAGLDRDRIDSVRIAPCGTDTRRLCAELIFSRPDPRPGITRDVVLTIQIDGTLGNPIPDTIGIHAAALALVTEADD